MTLAEPETAQEADAGVSTRIIGGTSTSASWMVQLFYDGYFYCGGTLVAPNKVLTAAHCLYDGSGNKLDWGTYGEVLAGTSVSGTVAGHGGTWVDVTRGWTHKSYSDATIQNDVAVLTLAKPLSYSTLEMAKPADSALYAPGTDATVYGWGMTSSTDPNSIASNLLKTTLPLNSDTDCTEYFNEAIGGGFVKDKMLCAGEPATGDDATAKTTCPGDSGGPLVVGNKIVGVVSWGIGIEGSKYCNVEGSYEVFSKVSTYHRDARPRVDDTDISRNGKADLFLRSDSAHGGKGYVKYSTGTGFGSRSQLSGSWSAYNLIIQADLNRDGYQDYVMRRSSDGAMYWRHRSASSSTFTDTKIASDWGTRKFNAVPGDVTGDRFPDLVSVTSGGTLYVYPGKGNGTFGTRVTGGTGYGAYNMLRGKGDFTNDGKSDLIVRGSGGKVYVLPGTGKASAPFGTAIHVRTWDNFNAYAAPGDVTGDGRPDFVVRSTAGNLYLYPGTGKATSEIFGTAVKIGSGYEQYNIFG
ncbi:trypsin-like serine protease [Streptomyces sp. GC420]|nr:trypsin-like serine protease [Streptomyces sp. GC420]